MWNWIADKLIERAKRTPYAHLYHADGSAYMKRYWLLGEDFKWPFAVRIHHICTPDYDRHMHDHPWSFVSVVLRNWYIEHRPLTISPCFGDQVEDFYITSRRTGSIAFRRATDRHSIHVVPAGGTWTLFISFRKVQWWGFYTPKGKIYYRDYESVHNMGVTR